MFFAPQPKAFLGYLQLLSIPIAIIGIIGYWKSVWLDARFPRVSLDLIIYDNSKSYILVGDIRQDYEYYCILERYGLPGGDLSRKVSIEKSIMKQLKKIYKTKHRKMKDLDAHILGIHENFAHNNHYVTIVVEIVLDITIEKDQIYVPAENMRTQDSHFSKWGWWKKEYIRPEELFPSAKNSLNKFINKIVKK